MSFLVTYDDQCRALVVDMFQERGEALSVLTGGEEEPPLLPQFRLDGVVEHDHGRQVKHGGRLVPVDFIAAR